MSQVLISPSKVSIALMTGIAVSLIVAILFWFWIGVEPVRNPTLNIESLPSAQTHSLNDVTAVLVRPLFWQEREPVTELEEEVIAVVETAKILPLTQVKLLGIILTGEVRRALLEVEEKVTSVQVGSVIQDWTVEAITAKEIIFVADTEQTVLSLERKRPDSIQLESIH